MKVLVAEDDLTHALIAARVLDEAGHQTVTVRNGIEALEALAKESFDAVVTDWMMPRMDGIELVRRMRAGVRPLPVVLVVTSLQSHEARAHALEAGADDYLARPYDPRELLSRLAGCLARRNQPRPARGHVEPHVSLAAPAPFVAVVVAASTGGPSALSALLAAFPPMADAAVFAVLHGPAWMLETFATRLEREAPLKVRLATDGMAVAPGAIYLAPGDRHMTIALDGLSVRIEDGEPENFVRPAADPLFRSAARAYGERCVAVVLTGMGRDGAAGCEHVLAAGGVVLAQDPATAAARSMPQTIVEMGLARGIAPLDRLPALIATHVKSILRA